MLLVQLWHPKVRPVLPHLTSESNLTAGHISNYIPFSLRKSLIEHYVSSEKTNLLVSGIPTVIKMTVQQSEQESVSV